jgi:hypothetical protein
VAKNQHSNKLEVFMGFSSSAMAATKVTSREEQVWAKQQW